MEKLDLKTYDVKNKVVIIKDGDNLTDSDHFYIASRLKKAGAIEVMFSVGGADFLSMNDEDLKEIGLMRIVKAEKKTEKKAKKKAKALN